MKTIVRGSGPTLVLVPGVQGRWEYLAPCVDALAKSFRVVTFPLCGERTCGLAFDPARGLENYTAQMRRVLDEQRADRAVVCGVSFGGLIALRFAAAHPERTLALVLVSAPGPSFRLRPRHRAYLRAPQLFGPFFLLEAPFRLRHEMAAAFPRLRDRLRFTARQLATLARAPLSPSHMAERALLIGQVDAAADCARVRVPTLVVCGERTLDFVVPADGTSEYARLIAGARHEVLARTGHLGIITRPQEFARLVSDFLSERARPADANGRSRWQQPSCA